MAVRRWTSRKWNTHAYCNSSALHQTDTTLFPFQAATMVRICSGTANADLRTMINGSPRDHLAEARSVIKAVFR
jgi:hypothetical protein